MINNIFQEELQKLKLLKITILHHLTVNLINQETLIT